MLLDPNVDADCSDILSISKSKTEGVDKLDVVDADEEAVGRQSRAKERLARDSGIFPARTTI